MLRPDRVGNLELGMTADEAIATGEAELGMAGPQGVPPEPELIADQKRYPGLLIAYDAGSDLIYGFHVDRPSPLRTPQGIGVDSAVSDLHEAYGPDLVEREQFDRPFFVLPSGDGGYAFFPHQTGMVIIIARAPTLERIGPGTEL
jgi:hypothetical protein